MIKFDKISLIVAQNLPDCKMQMFTALILITKR